MLKNDMGSWIPFVAPHGIVQSMSTPPNLRDRVPPPKEANFGVVVLLAGLALVVIFIVAVAFVGADGRHILPRTRPSNFEPTSQLIMPASNQSIRQIAC